MARLIALFALACTIGCQTSESEIEPQPGRTPAQVKENGPTSEATGGSTDVTEDREQSGQAVSSTDPDQATNPKRIHQLGDLERITIRVGGKPVRVWVMDTNSKRQEGMMWLEDKEVKRDEGMLFVFPTADTRGFWMRNTLIALDLAFISSDGKILNIVQGKPLDEETSLASAGPAQYVLEMKQGAMKRLGAKAGTRVTIPPGLDPQ